MMTAATATTPQRRGATPVRRREIRAGYLFVLPFMVVFVLMLLVPLVYAGYISLYQSTLIAGVKFGGLANYAKVFTDPLFLEGLGRMALFLVIQVPIMLALSLFIALALDSGRVRGQGTVRLLTFMPYAVPGVVATLM